MAKDFVLTCTNECLTLKKGKTQILFDQKVNSGKGVIFGVKIVGGKADLKKSPEKIKVEDPKDHLHQIQSHAGAAKTEAMAKKFGYKSEKTVDFKYKDCYVEKQKQNNLKQVTDKVYKRRGEMMYVGISSVKPTSQGGKKFWILWCDAATKMLFGQFVKKKLDLVQVTVKLIEKLWRLVSMHFLRCFLVIKHHFFMLRSVKHHIVCRCIQIGLGLRRKYLSTVFP